ncbi:MAG: CapA family protein [Candidatus Moranbacteria bacterium]|nr:CapA family protein [Candidatus Moranbacteria bacterium]
MKDKQIRKIILLLVLLAGLVLAGLFLAGKKTASFESIKFTTEKQKVFTAEQVSVESKKPVRILFVGDMMFDRYIRQVSEKKGSDFVFAGVKEMLSGSDLVIGNLEGPITDKPSVSVGSKIGVPDNYIFTFDPAVGGQLWKNNIHLVNLGNNHILNFGEEGLSKTKENLKSSGVDFFGDPAGEKRLAIWEKNGTKIVFVSYNQFEKDAKSKTLVDIVQAKKAKTDWLVLYAHWGTEFASQSSDNIKDLAHSFIDSGVDLVIGSHPHVVQDKEEYKGKMIYYSLGNFIFDQYFSPQTQRGMAVQFEMNSRDGKISAKEFLVSMKNSGQTILK